MRVRLDRPGPTAVIVIVAAIAVGVLAVSSRSAAILAGFSFVAASLMVLVGTRLLGPLLSRSAGSRVDTDLAEDLDWAAPWEVRND